jgi:hypothetical protein
MIRPFTCLVFLLACGSGLYLYQAKHRVKLLDDRIAAIAHSTDALREQTRMLSAEWTLLNDPERLRQLATQFLTLQTVSPNQFTSLADLDSRLPAPVPPGSQQASPQPGAPPDAGTAAPPAQVPVASNAAGGSGEGTVADAQSPGAKPAAGKVGAGATGTRIADASPTASPKDVAPSASRAASPRTATTVAAEPSRPAEHKPALPRLAFAPPRAVASQQRPSDQHTSDQRASDRHVFAQRETEPRLAEARPMVRVQAPAPMPNAGGSLLGMAHGMGAPPAPVPLPRPMPVSMPQFANAPGG